MFYYRGSFEDIGFHPHSDSLLTYKGNRIRSISMCADGESTIYGNMDSQFSYDDFLSIIEREEPNDSIQEEISREIGNVIMFMAFDHDDHRVIVLSPNSFVYVVDSNDLSVISSFRLDVDNLFDIGRDRVAYDMVSNLLMIATDTYQLTIWHIDTSLEIIGTRVIEPFRVNQIILHPNGTYLAARGHSRIEIYEIRYIVD